MGGTIDGAGLKIGHERHIRFGLWLLVLLPVTVIFALCYRPVMRLKPQPPPGFVETKPEWNATRQSAEDRAAQAYWQLAINIVQWRFGFGTELPAEPIQEFRLDPKDFPRSTIAAAPDTRRRYWNKLRTTWPQPDAWTETYVWNTDWLRESLSSFMEAILRFTDNILGRINK